MITGNCYYSNNTLFIRDLVWDWKVLLIARSGRFGKDINLSMLRYFYDNYRRKGRELKADLSIPNEEVNYLCTDRREKLRTRITGF